ncbi:MAG: AMP-binding protein [Candidatus Lokiarchaeota archaeon]|nr:AMP-binding protein [Candidatus Lokiarchaeota archaeon]
MKKSPFKKFISIKANHYPKDRVSIVHGDKRITWKELNERINRLGNGLIDIDAEKGDKIALILYNSPEFLESNFASQGIGAVPVPINYRLVGNEFEYILNNCDAKILIFDEDVLPIIQEIRDELPLIEHYIYVGDKEKTPEDMVNYYQFINEHKNKELKADVSYDDIGLILYTGGTTGMPKGVVLTYDNLVTNIEMVGVFMTNALPPVSRLKKRMEKGKRSIDKKIQGGMQVLSGLSIFQALADDEDLAKKISIIELQSDADLKIPPMTATGDGEGGLKLFYGKAKEWDIYAKVFLGREIRDLAESGPLSYSTRGKIKNFFPMIWKYLIGGTKGINLKGPFKLKLKLIGASTKTPPPEEVINLLLLPPLFHSAGYIFLVQWLLFGCKLVMPGSKSFNAEEVVNYLHDEKIHITLMVPTMWKRIVEYPSIEDYDFSDLKIAMSGGALLKGKYKKKMIELFPNALIFDALGQTEMSPIVSVKLDGDVEAVKDRSVGKMVAGLDYKIVDEEGKVVPDGEIGELCYKSSTIMKEYYKDKEKTKASMTEDGFFYSGDLAYRGEDGEVYLVDRKKSCINTGGEKVYALEVEECIMEHPKVKNVCVIGVPNDEWGSIVRAVVQLKEGEEATKEEIQDFCKGKIAGFKKPRSVVFTDEFPISPVGKIQRGKVKKQYGTP